MTQRSKLTGFFNKPRKLNIRIDIPALAVGESREYPSTCDEIKNKFRNYGCFNFFKIVNTLPRVLRVYLDFNNNRSYDNDYTNEISGVEFTEFVIENIGATDLLIGEGIIYVGYLPEYERGNRLIDKILGGT